MAGQTILVVDDDDGARYYAQRVLEAAGFFVLTASDAPSALLQASRKSVNLLLCDIHMPNSVGGLPLARVLQRAHPSMKVLFISAYPPPADLPPNVTILHRPISPENLVAEVTEILRDFR